MRQNSAERPCVELVVDRGNVLPIPVPVDGARNLFRPERDATRAEMRVSETVVVEIPAASAHDVPTRSRKEHHGQNRTGYGLLRRNVEAKANIARSEDRLDFFEREGERFCRDVGAQIEGDRLRHVPGREREERQESEHALMVRPRA